MAEILTQDIEKRVIKVISETLGREPEEITPETLYSNLNMDSLDRIELLMDLQEEFESLGVNISDEEADKIQNVREAVELIKTKVQDQKPEVVN